MSTYTLTFCDRAENHKGMQMIGAMAQQGYTIEELDAIYVNLTNNGFKCEYVNLGCYDANNNVIGDVVKQTGGARVLVIRNALATMFQDEKAADYMYYEHANIQQYWDKQALMYGRVVNKNVRHNLCFGDCDQEPDYEHGKGRIINFVRLPYTNHLRNFLPSMLGPKAQNLQAEANYYYDINKCYIGYHGDAERRLVVGVRLGATLPLYFRWYQNGDPLDLPTEILLNHGDMYIMSDKAVGNDWKKKKIPTLRHSAGVYHNVHKS